MKRALITGITGQDGSYLAELLLEKGYEVHGAVRRVALGDQSVRLARIRHILHQVTLHAGSVQDYGSMTRIVQEVSPHECYHLAAQSFVVDSNEDPHTTLNTNIMGTLNMLMAVRDHDRECRFYNAASSEMFGKVAESPQSEQTPFHPRSPYGVSKVAAYGLTCLFREAHGMFACNGILFNHESPRRGMEFVTRKITHGVAEIKAGRADKLVLGNLDARRDWGHSRDYVRAMHLMLQADSPDDYVIATGESHSIKEFCKAAFGEVGLDWEAYVVVSDEFKRPSDVHTLCGDATKAERRLGWKPVTDFRELVKEMVDAEGGEI